MDRNHRIFLCAAFSPGLEVTSYIVARFPGTLVGAATCDRDDSPFEARIAECLAGGGVEVVRRMDLNSAGFRSHLVPLAVDIVLMAWIPTIIKGQQLAAARVGWVNMHPSLLPWGRGKHAYYWTCVEGTPFGATLHFIDEKIDAGRILWQKVLDVTPSDTGESLYHRSVQATVQLLRDNYGRLLRGEYAAWSPSEHGSFHSGRELDAHSQIDLERTYRGAELLDILRGRSFANGASAFFIKNGRKYYVRVRIDPADEGHREVPENA